MLLEKLLRNWREDLSIFGNVSAWHVIPDRKAEFEPLPEELDSGLVSALGSIGIHRLYTHQALSWSLAQAGKSFVVATGTASGKTLCYNLPVLDLLIKDPKATGLYIFPTKALAQDQLATLKRLTGTVDTIEHSGSRILPSLYDGDTPVQARPNIRGNSRIILTNPDMLHTGILPHHTGWSEFFRNLRFIIIDEMHVYRGVFGSHFANVLRRLQRILKHYGARPQFILSSATIANPVELAEKLIENPVVMIDRDGSERGAQVFWIYNPPIMNPELGLRRSALQESIRLASDLIDYNIQTAIFARSRRSVELLLTYLRENTAAKISPTMADLLPNQIIRGYRSGYLPRQRREIEQGLRSGSVRVVVATNALELGVDIGGMDAVLISGYPGSIAATWQQSGRAGRKTDTSLAVLLLTSDPLDQYLAAHPEYFLDRSPERALINPDNLLILLAHLRCAAFELPFKLGQTYGTLDANHLQEFLDTISGSGEIHPSAGQYFWVSDQYPASDISMRTASPTRILLQVAGDRNPATIGELDLASALRMAHPQAIYIHEGQTYHVDELDLEQNIARLDPVNSDYYTEPRIETLVHLIELQKEEHVIGGDKSYGEIVVESRVIGYRKIKWFTYEPLGTGVLDLPASTLQTTGYWLTLSDETVANLRESGLWRNDPIDYGPSWVKQRNLTRQRDGYRCQVCGAPEQGREHDVHHRTPFRTFPTSEQANQLTNLITLCHPCHRRVETVVKVRSGLGGLAYTLGHLAPLFIMCDPLDLGVNSDPQSPLSAGKPTVVLYDQVPAGIGLSQGLYEIHEELVSSAYELVTGCPCLDGCPSCVGPAGERGTGSKHETRAILQMLISSSQW